MRSIVARPNKAAVALAVLCLSGDLGYRVHTAHARARLAGIHGVHAKVLQQEAGCV